MKKESHQLPNVGTSFGKDVECRALILKNLIGEGAGGSPKPVGGMVLSIEEKYGSKALYIDQDEVDGILAAMNYLDKNGLAVVSESILAVEAASETSTEVHYSTRDGLTLGMFVSADKLRYALKIGATADWAILTDGGAKQLRLNFDHVSEALKALAR